MGDMLPGVQRSSAPDIVRKSDIWELTNPRANKRDGSG